MMETLLLIYTMCLPLLPRLKTALRAKGIEIVGDATPRAPLSNQLNLGELYPPKRGDEHRVANRSDFKKIEVGALIAGGGIAGSALFRYMADSGLNPVLVNADRGSSWRNIGGGRTAFSLPELAEIAEPQWHIPIELRRRIPNLSTAILKLSEDCTTN